MICGFCGKSFDLDQCGSGCTGCPLRKGCGGVRCPYCGYNNVQEGSLIRWLRSVFATDPGVTQSGRDR